MITNILLLAAILTLAKIHSYFERIVDKYKNIEETEDTIESSQIEAAKSTDEWIQENTNSTLKEIPVSNKSFESKVTSVRNFIYNDPKLKISDRDFSHHEELIKTKMLEAIDVYNRNIDFKEGFEDINLKLIDYESIPYLKGSLNHKELIKIKHSLLIEEEEQNILNYCKTQFPKWNIITRRQLNELEKVLLNVNGELNDRYDYRSFTSLHRLDRPLTKNEEKTLRYLNSEYPEIIKKFQLYILNVNGVYSSSIFFCEITEEKSIREFLNKTNFDLKDSKVYLVLTKN